MTLEDKSRIFIDVPYGFQRLTRRDFTDIAVGESLTPLEVDEDARPAPRFPRIKFLIFIPKGFLISAVFLEGS